MGRGRAKAKQTKVARELKYSSPQTDLKRLQEELGGSPNGGDHPALDEELADDSWVKEDDWRR